MKNLLEKLKDGTVRDILRESAWIYGYTRRYRLSILLYIVLGVTGTLLSLGNSVVSKYLIDTVTIRSTSALVPTAIMFVVLGIAGIGFTALNSRISAKISIKVGNEMRAGIFKKFLDVDWQSSLEYHSGDLLSRVNRDVDTVADSVLGWVPSLIISLAQFVAILVILVYYDPVMALLTLCSVPVTAIISRTLVGRLRSFGQEVRKTDARLISFYEEALGNLQAIKAFDLKNHFTGKLDELQTLYKNVSLDFNLFSVRMRSLLSLLNFVTGGITFAWSIYRLWTGYISFGSLVLFMRLAGMLGSSFSGLVALIPSAVNATVSAGRIMTILDLPMEDNTLGNDAAAVLAHASEDGVLISLDDVHFSYADSDGTEIFSGLNLSAAPGEIIGIVSPSGIGKTTLLRMLLGLIKPSSGSVLFSSGGVTAPLTPALRCLITYVAQEKVVFTGTIGDCLRLCCPDASDEKLETALRAACAWDFVSALPEGINTPLKERGAGLSEGQIQRLAIARALLSPAPIMLLDEATSALDMETEKQVISNILAGPVRRTVIVTTHRPTVLGSCTRVCSLENGTAIILNEEQLAKKTQ